jgi:hypothetical protein
MKEVKPEISEYFRELNKKRKKRVGGFSSPEVQAKALKKRMETNARKKAEKERQFASFDKESGQGVQ